MPSSLLNRVCNIFANYEEKCKRCNFQTSKCNTSKSLIKSSSSTRTREHYFMPSSLKLSLHTHFQVCQCVCVCVCAYQLIPSSLSPKLYHILLKLFLLHCNNNTNNNNQNNNNSQTKARCHCTK